ncbi:MAG TPA: GNAT family N-acetyltransferase [Thermoanaerobaculia bacterium]|nr:GNAT family N-acetyltransferase [Thermoanaerobaculia bacterium]
MRIQQLTSLEELQEIEPAWLDLWRRDPHATPFQSPQWILPWHRHFGSGEIFAAAMWSGDRLEALAPFLIVRDDDDPSESLGMLLGTGNTDYVDVLATSDEAVGEIVKCLVHVDCAMWDLRQLRPTSPLLRVRPPEGWTDNVEQDDPSVVLSIGGAGLELENLISTHFRKKIRYYRHSLARLGAVTVHEPATETLGAFMDSLYTLHAARWKERGLPGMLAADVDQSFHREVARGMLAAGALRMYAIRVDGRDVALFYGFAARDTVYYYLSGYDPSIEKLSPGTLLVAHAIEQAVRSGVKTFDFLRGAEDYKYAWGAKDRWNRRRQLTRG